MIKQFILAHFKLRTLGIAWAIKSALFLILAVGCTATEPALEPEGSQQEATQAPVVENTPTTIPPTVAPLPTATPEPAPDPTQATTNSTDGKMADISYPLENRTWLLVAYGGGGRPAAVMDGTGITAEFAGGAVSGSSGCNSYGGSYTLVNDQLTIEPNMMSTLMACESPKGIMQQEQLYLEGLAAAETITIEGDTLIINYGFGQLYFEAQPTVVSSLEGSEWALDGLAKGDAVSVPAKVGEITITLANGQVSGFAGCNQFFGSYELDEAGGKLTFGPLGATRMACGEEGVMADEAEFLELLGSAQQFSVDGNVLIINHNTGALLFIIK